MKGKKLLAGVLSAAMVLGTMAFPAFADGETISTQTEFETALSTLADGDTLVLDAGAFTIPETVTEIKTNVTITGAGKDGTTVTVNKPITVETDSFTLKNLVIDGSAIHSFNDDKVIAYSGKNAVFENVDFLGGGQNTYGANLSISLKADDSIADFSGCNFSKAFRGVQIWSMKNSVVKFDSCVMTPECYTLNVDGEQPGGILVVKNSTLSGWTSYAKIEKALFENVAFEKMSGGYGYNYVKPYADTAFDNCDFNFTEGDNTAKIEMVYSDNMLAITNSRLNGEPVDSSNMAKLVSADSAVSASNITVPVAKNGVSYYATLKDAVAAAQDGDTITILGKIAVKDGDLPSSQSSIGAKTLTFKGADENSEMTFVDGVNGDGSDNAYYAHGSNLTFDGLKITWIDVTNYQGIMHPASVEYKNCTISGMLTLYGNKNTFTDCHFVQNADNKYAYNIWTWGSMETEFKNCKFTCRGKSINVYGGGDYATKDDYLAATNQKKLTIDNCEFYVENKVDGCDASAIAIKTKECPYDITIKDSTAVGFVESKTTGSQLYDVKDMHTDVAAADEETTVTVNENSVDLTAVKEALANGSTNPSDAKPVIKIALVKNDTASTEDSHVYDIKVVSDSDINKLNSTDLTFSFVTDKANEYAITAAENVVLTNDGNSNRYMFSYKNGTVRETAKEITIGQATVTGYGKYTLKVDDSASTNVVNATTLAASLVDSYVTDGSADGKLDIADSTTDENGQQQEIKIPTRKLSVKIYMNNKVADQKKAYQAMKVDIAGGDYSETIALGSDATAQANKIYMVEKELPINTAYTVTVSGAGYRTARYTVNLTSDKTLNFWNNVGDNAIEVELGNEAYKKDVTFLAGDIVKDGTINIYDLSAVVSYFGTINNVDAESEYAKYDLNRDGKIDSKDVAYVLVSWGM